jgi:hypothetical protein
MWLVVAIPLPDAGRTSMSQLRPKKPMMLVPLFALAVAAVTTLGAHPAWAATPEHPLTDVPIFGTARNGNAFAGTVTILSFVNDPEKGLEAVGLLNGVITQATGGATTTITNAVVLLPVQLPTGGVARAAVTCQILNLVLAPLDLNLLGLTVHLNQVVLNVAAQAGAGNLLGNLLCAVTNLLNGSPLADLGAALLGVLTALLNQLIGLL